MTVIQPTSISLDQMAATGRSASVAAEEQLTLDYNAFLQLMMAQMKNQDPTDPVDATQQLAELASFSQVEQAIKTNTKLEAMLTNMSFGQVDDLIGRTVTDSTTNVSGLVKSVEIYSDGTMLALDNGKKILLGPGVKIS